MVRCSTEWSLNRGTCGDMTPSLPLVPCHVLYEAKQLRIYGRRCRVPYRRLQHPHPLAFLPMLACSLFRRETIAWITPTLGGFRSLGMRIFTFLSHRPMSDISSSSPTGRVSWLAQLVDLDKSVVRVASCYFLYRRSPGVPGYSASCIGSSALIPFAFSSEYLGTREAPGCRRQGTSNMPSLMRDGSWMYESRAITHVTRNLSRHGETFPTWKLAWFHCTVHFSSTHRLRPQRT